MIQVIIYYQQYIINNQSVDLIFLNKYQMNYKNINADRIQQLNTASINQSRNGLYYEQQQQIYTPKITNTGTLNFVQTRNFKLEIQKKFNESRHNKYYIFPVKSNVLLDDEDKELRFQLQKVRFYNLKDQNEKFELMRHRKSRSQTNILLFQSTLQKQRFNQSKQKSVRSKQNTVNAAPLIKGIQLLRKKNTKDKQNNLNFQNLLNESKTNNNISNSKLKATQKPKNIKSLLNNSKIQIPKLIFNKQSDKTSNDYSQIKCFRDLKKFEINKR